MTEPTPQPQPVTRAAHLAGLVSGAFTAIAGLVFWFKDGGFTTKSIEQTGTMLALSLTAVLAVASYVITLLHGKNAADQVTPTSSPRDDDGNVLAPVTELAEVVHVTPTGPDTDTFRAVLDRDFEEWKARTFHHDDTQEMPAVTPRRRLGRKPPTNAPRIKLTADLVPAAAFTPPPSVDWYSKVPSNTWGMDGNDTVGDCTLAEIDHSTKARQVAAGNLEVKSTAAECLAAYSAITGYDPKRPSTDQGAVMQDVRDYWRKHGIVLGGTLDKLTLFAAVDHTDLDLIKWCVSRFGAVALGINFPDSAMDQFDAGQPWDVVRGATIEGGHAISMVGYDDTYAYVITWGEVQKMTWAFFEKYVEEAWTDVSADWINASSGQDPLGEVAYALGEQFAQVTGQPNPFPAPQPPAPAPGPAPAPAPVVTPPPDTVRQWAERTLALKHEKEYAHTGAEDYLAWLAQQ